MTANQLKYWELRWKQHYEHILAKVKVAEVSETQRHNIATEAETRRHNMREERIDTQNMITNRLNAQIRWEELSERKRAAIVAEALKQKEYELAVQTELRNERYTAAQIDKMLSDKKIAQMELAMSIVKNKHDIAANYLKAEAALFKNGWTKAAAGEIIADVKSLLSSAEADQLLNNLTKDPDFKWLTESFGPDTATQTLNIASSSSSNSQGDSRDWQGPPTREQKQIADNRIRFENRPDFQSVGNEDLVQGHTTSPSNQGSGTSIEYGRSGARYHSNHKTAGSTRGPVETKTSNGTSIVYSGGSHYGPGYV